MITITINGAKAQVVPGNHEHHSYAYPATGLESVLGRTPVIDAKTYPPGREARH